MTCVLMSLAAALCVTPEALSWPVTIAWDPNPAAENVTGYTVHYGPTSRFAAGFTSYAARVDVGKVTQHTVDLPVQGITYYLAVTARNQAGLQSEFSMEVPAGGAPAAGYTIAASAGPNGSIAPAGTVAVDGGGTQAFSITPAAGYRVADVLVDGQSVGTTTSYVFSGVTSNHTISAAFAANAPSQATYTISAAAGAGGSISPSGVVSVNSGSSRTFTITPSAGHRVADVLVDGNSVGVTTSYPFVGVTSNHTIAASFAANTPPTATYAISAAAGGGGSISPSGVVSVNSGASRTFTITPAAGYFVADVLVDGRSVGSTTSYSFVGVTASHTIEARFAAYSLSEFAPFVSQPISGATVNSFTPTLSVFNPLVSGSPSYEFQVASDPEMTQIVASRAGIAQGIGVTAWTVPEASLRDKTRYYWRAGTSGGGQTGRSWSTVATFYLDTAAAATTLVPGESGYLTAATDTVLEISNLTSEASGVRVEFSAGSVSFDTILTVGTVHSGPAPTSGVRSLGKVYNLGPHGVPFARPATLMLPYSSDDIARAGLPGPEELGVLTYNTSSLRWEPVPVYARDYKAKRLICRVGHFSMYAVGTSDSSSTGRAFGGADGTGCFLGEASAGADVRRSWILLFLWAAAILVHRLPRAGQRVSAPAVSKVSRKARSSPWSRPSP